MGFGWGDVGSWALAPVTGGGSLVLKNQWDKSRQGNNPALPYKSGGSARASDITMDSGLMKVLGEIGTDQSKNVSGAYGRASTQADNDARRSGSYYDELLAKGEGLSQGDMRSGLESVLGDEGYGDWKSARDYQDNMALAKLTGELNKPSTLEEILGALNGGASSAGNFYGLYNGVRRDRQPSRYASSSYPANDFADIG